MAERKGKDAAPRGAVGRKISLLDRLDGYSLHHRATARVTFAKLIAEPLQTLMTVLVVAIALALPAALYMAVENIQQLGDSFDDSSRMTVFLDHGARTDAIEAVRSQIAGLSGVAEVSYISPEDGLQEFRQYSGFGAALDYLDENPLPPVLLVRPLSTGEAGLDQAGRLLLDIRKLALVDDVQLDMAWLQRLDAILTISRKAALALGLALGLGVLLVVGNTIRLAIESRRDEIIVVKLVGGTNAYVRRPFLYTGLLYGLMGALMAWLMVLICLFWLDGSVARLASLYQSGFRLQGLGVDGLLWLILCGTLLGLGGAFVAVSRHLRDIEPR